jgi:hypothetical protein
MVLGQVGNEPSFRNCRIGRVDSGCFRTSLAVGEYSWAVLVDLVEVFRSCMLKAAPDLSYCSIDDSCVNSCLSILGDDPMTELVVENFAVLGLDT